MLNNKATLTESKNHTAFLLASKPTAPISTRLPLTEKKVNDPSASVPRGKSYPIPSFFEYRAKPKEHDSL